MKNDNGLVGVIAHRDKDGKFGKAKAFGTPPPELSEADKRQCDILAKALAEKFFAEFDKVLAGEVDA